MGDEVAALLLTLVTENTNCARNPAPDTCTRVAVIQAERDVWHAEAEWLVSRFTRAG